MSATYCSCSAIAFASTGDSSSSLNPVQIGPSDTSCSRNTSATTASIRCLSSGIAANVSGAGSSTMDAKWVVQAVNRSSRVGKYLLTVGSDTPASSATADSVVIP